MVLIPDVEKNYPSVDMKPVKSEGKDDEINRSKYSPKYIAKLLTEKDRNGRALFFFGNISDYITLYSNGHLNARGGEQDLFRTWGSSEFRNLAPHAVFQKLEKEIVKINMPVSERDYSFNSYSEFINWLTNQSDKNQGLPLKAKTAVVTKTINEEKK
jgi:predicted glycosyltransferase involved in capsule biosynthesis